MKPIHLMTGCLFCAVTVEAQDAAFQASLTPEVAIYSKSTEVQGLSLSIWGENPQHGVAFGFVNGSTGDSRGFSLGLVNYADSYSGVSWGFVNFSQTSFVGWQNGWLNVSQGECNGFQLGLVNYAGNLHGVQVGFANIAMNNPWFDDFPNKLATGFPVINWSF